MLLPLVPVITARISLPGSLLLQASPTTTAGSCGLCQLLANRGPSPSPPPLPGTVLLQVHSESSHVAHLLGDAQSGQLLLLATSCCLPQAVSHAKNYQAARGVAR